MHDLARAASAHLILEFRGPWNVEELSRWEGIADFDSGHGYLQKRWVINSYPNRP